MYFQSDPTVHDENIGSIITHVCELNFTSLFNHAVVFVNAYFKLLRFNNYNKSTKQHVIETIQVIIEFFLHVD